MCVRGWGRGGLARRSFRVAAFFVVVVLVACTSDSGPEAVGLSETSWRKAACALPADWLDRIDHGTQRGGGRGSDLVVVANPEHYIGDEINTSHSGPYDHLQEIPLLFYGPGYVKEAQQITDPVTLTSVAPTTARLIGFDLQDVDAAPLESALVQGVAGPPQLVVTIVIDGGGTNVFEYWPDSWPNLRRLSAEGTSYLNATVGSSPSITPASHTTIGTGVYPRRHGVTAISIRKRGEITGAFTVGTRAEDNEVDPRVTLSHPTLPELYDRAEDNEPLVALLGFGSWVTGLVGRGSAFPGGDEDIVGYFDG
ncbi:MAG TPA: alkaline phosphatase family protein, partial [Actinomycetota bacterium]|nr:alkaline phosphatase family protein [Actinomycetota bacterium]